MRSFCVCVVCQACCGIGKLGTSWAASGATSAPAKSCSSSFNVGRSWPTLGPSRSKLATPRSSSANLGRISPALGRHPPVFREFGYLLDDVDQLSAMFTKSGSNSDRRGQSLLTQSRSVFPVENTIPDHSCRRRPEEQECNSGPVGNLPDASATNIGLTPGQPPETDPSPDQPPETDPSQALRFCGLIPRRFYLETFMNGVITYALFFPWAKEDEVNRLGRTIMVSTHLNFTGKEDIIYKSVMQASGRRYSRVWCMRAGGFGVSL